MFFSANLTSVLGTSKKPNCSDHDQALTIFLETARECNVQLNYEKLQYKKQEVDFFRETYTTSGCKPDKNKVTAITKMPVPTNKKQVQSFLGMINYLSKFSARLSEIVEPIRELAKDIVPFSWDPEHQSTSTKMKKEIASTPILAYYNPKKKTDASVKGLGTCLLQAERPV